MIAYVFPGQGSQFIGMGKELFDSHADVIDQADNILGYSIKTLCLEDPDNQLGLTQFTQPALFVVNTLMWLKEKNECEQMPDFFAGHSLGEYNALFAADVFDYETGLKLVQKRGQLMSQAKNGGMAALIGFNEDQIRQVLQDNQLNNIFLANYNSPEQIVISGLQAEINRAEPLFKAAGLKLFVKLKVSGAFHTKYMDDAAKTFAKFMDGFSFYNTSIPVISNVSGLPHESGKIKEGLYNQIISPVLWTNSIHYLLEQSVETFKEIGPGNVLQRLINKIRKEVTG